MSNKTLPILPALCNSVVIVINETVLERALIKLVGQLLILTRVELKPWKVAFTAVQSYTRIAQAKESRAVCCQRVSSTESIHYANCCIAVAFEAETPARVAGLVNLSLHALVCARVWWNAMLQYRRRNNELIKTWRGPLLPPWVVVALLKSSVTGNFILGRWLCGWWLKRLSCFDRAEQGFRCKTMHSNWLLCTEQPPNSSNTLRFATPASLSRLYTLSIRNNQYA